MNRSVLVRYTCLCVAMVLSFYLSIKTQTIFFIYLKSTNFAQNKYKIISLVLTLLQTCNFISIRCLLQRTMNLGWLKIIRSRIVCGVTYICCLIVSWCCNKYLNNRLWRLVNITYFLPINYFFLIFQKIIWFLVNFKCGFDSKPDII